MQMGYGDGELLQLRLRMGAVLLFTKSNKIRLRYFDPKNIFLDDNNT